MIKAPRQIRKAPSEKKKTTLRRDGQTVLSIILPNIATIAGNSPQEQRVLLGAALFFLNQLLDKWTLKTNFSKVYYTACKATLAKRQRRLNLNDANVNDLKVDELREHLIARGVDIKGLKKPDLRELLEDARRNNLPIVIAEQPEEEVEEEEYGDEELDRDTIQIVDDGDCVDDSDSDDE